MRLPFLPLLVALMTMLAGLAKADPLPPLGGMLKAPEAWQAYKRAFITDGGRVVDNANGNVSHSEGQGYGMLLAVAADDREAFDAIWSWTRAQLMLREDGLAAWRWNPDASPHVGRSQQRDRRRPLIAWALAEAGRALAGAGLPHRLACDIAGAGRGGGRRLALRPGADAGRRRVRRQGAQRRPGPQPVLLGVSSAVAPCSAAAGAAMEGAVPFGHGSRSRVEDRPGAACRQTGCRLPARISCRPRAIRRPSAMTRSACRSISPGPASPRNAALASFARAVARCVASAAEDRPRQRRANGGHGR